MASDFDRLPTTAELMAAWEDTLAGIRDLIAESQWAIAVLQETQRRLQAERDKARSATQS
jgi:hypothetical protein